MIARIEFDNRIQECCDAAVIVTGGGCIAIGQRRAAVAALSRGSRLLPKCDVRVIVDIDDQKIVKADALRLGADAFVSTSDPKALKPLRKSFDMVLSTVSSPIDLDAYLRTLKTRGTLVIVGLPVEDMSFNAGTLVEEARGIVGAKLAGVEMTQEMLDFCAEHGIVADVEVIDIADINSAWERIKTSDVRYRFVIDTATLG